MKFELKIFHCAGIRQTVSHTLLRFKTNGENAKLLDYEITISIMPQAFSTCSPHMEATAIDFMEEVQGQFVTFTAEICKTTGIKDSDKAEIPMSS